MFILLLWQWFFVTRWLEEERLSLHDKQHFVVARRNKLLLT